MTCTISEITPSEHFISAGPKRYSYSYMRLVIDNMQHHMTVESDRGLTLNFAGLWLHGLLRLALLIDTKVRLVPLASHHVAGQQQQAILGLPDWQDDHHSGGNKAPDDGDDNPEGEIRLGKDPGREGQAGPDDDQHHG
eukprot:scaffold132204_cov26-Prasinocladus_malaysianus.AAC.1